MTQPHPVYRYQPLQIMPAPSGLMAIFQDEPTELLVPVVAMAVCLVREEWFLEGKFVRRGKSRREVCGIQTTPDIGFAVCEEASNFMGYLAAGEKP